MKISKEANINYLAKVVKLEFITPVPDSDNLVMTSIDGNTIVMNKQGLEVGQIMVYFPAESCISDWYLSANNLFKDSDMNHDKTKKGFFEKNGRVRCIKLRGQISSGFLMPYKTLGIPYEESVLNQEFDTINNKVILKKYVVLSRIPQEQVVGKKRKGKIISKVIDNQFRFHIDTPQLVKNIRSFKLDTEISITRKMHGTSGISSYVLCNKTVSKGTKFITWINNNVLFPVINLFGGNNRSENKTTDYDYLYSSRSVVKNNISTLGFYNVDVWKYADDVIKPHLIKGMTMYYEIVGYLPTGKMIQKDYSYGMIPPRNIDEYRHGVHFNIYIYRITLTNPDGNVTEFNSQMVKNYCVQHGLNHVTEFFRGTVRDFLAKDIQEVVLIGGADCMKVVNTLKYDHEIVNILDSLEAVDGNELIQDRFVTKLTNKYLEKIAYDCGKKVPDEGIVIRNESKALEVYKFKSKNFLLKETIDLDSGEVNIEG